MTDAEQKIIEALGAADRQSRTGFELSEATGLGTATLYPALARLERDGKLLSCWADGEYPRKRLYRLRD